VQFRTSSDRHFHSSTITMVPSIGTKLENGLLKPLYLLNTTNNGQKRGKSTHKNQIGGDGISLHWQIQNTYKRLHKSRQPTRGRCQYKFPHPLGNLHYELVIDGGQLSKMSSTKLLKRKLDEVIATEDGPCPNLSRGDSLEWRMPYPNKF